MLERGQLLSCWQPLLQLCVQVLSWGGLIKIGICLHDLVGKRVDHVAELSRWLVTQLSMNRHFACPRVHIYMNGAATMYLIIFHPIILLLFYIILKLRHQEFRTFRNIEIFPVVPKIM